MGDAKNPSAPGYFQQYLARMAPTPLPPPPLPFPASASPRPALLAAAPASVPGVGRRKEIRNDRSASNGKPRKSLVDAFKQHDMKLCDGSKLNAVSKGVTHLGAIPPTLGVHITALYLSQNELRGLEGIEQFKNVRLLSVAGNRLARLTDVERLKELTQLRHLNLTGNPLCDHPNYRFRVVDALRSVAVLDAVDVSKQERELAPLIVSQDRALRDMVIKNHVEIQKLQRIALWIGVLGELQCGVLRDAVTGRFDQLPTPNGDSAFNTDRFLRVWCHGDSMSPREHDALEAQMMAIVARTRSKLSEETPQTKAKEMLFKLAHASAVRRGKLNDLPPAMRREHCVWEDAYAHVLQLQQQTIANLRSECDRNRQVAVDAMKELVIINPSKRRAFAMHDEDSHRRRPTMFPQRVVHSANRDISTVTNPGDCQEDHRQRVINVPPVSNEMVPTLLDKAQASVNTPCGPNRQHLSEQDGTYRRPNQVSLRRVLRSGQFGNKTLNEAIHSFSLRQPVLPKPPTARRTVRTSPTYLQAHASGGLPPACENDVSERPTTNNVTLVLSRRTSPKHPCSSQSQLPSEHDSVAMAGMETVCSAGTTYAASAVDISSDYYSDSESLSNSSILVTSRAQQNRSRDELLHHREVHPLELKTVYEDDSMSESHGYTGDNTSLQSQDTMRPRMTRPRFLSERQHELEAREEKYITALMESEQRELDLRQRINMMNNQLAQYQQLLYDNETERQRIKLEINERAAAVARPTLLRRFFDEWLSYYQWSLQVRHIRRKRRFITQHDAFWCWRRQIWARQQLQQIQRRHHARLLRIHLIEWANLTRISVIALHTQALRQSQLMKRVVDEWRQQIQVQNIMRCMLESRKTASSQQRLAATFLEWRRVMAQSRQLRQVQAFYARGAIRALKQALINNWKVYVLAIARPQRVKMAGFAASLVASSKKHHMVGWRQVTKSEGLYRSHLRRKVWKAWRSSIQLHVNERDRAIRVRVDVLKRNFMGWCHVAADRAASRRSLNLAMRHVNHRRLRKLWMYWKIYSIARKRYMQGASKALKHYYKKLLRRTWVQWKQDTRENLVSRKTKKRGELWFHFNALREGVRKLMYEKKRQVFVSHTTRRRTFVHLRQSFTTWSQCTKRRRRCTTLHQFLAGNRARSLVSFAWSHWKTLRVVQLRRMLMESNQHKLITAEEKKEAQREIKTYKDIKMSCTNVNFKSKNLKERWRSHYKHFGKQMTNDKTRANAHNRRVRFTKVNFVNFGRITMH